MNPERQKVLVVGRREGKTDMIREHVEVGVRVISMEDLKACPGLSVDFVSFDELARCLLNPGDNWIQSTRLLTEETGGCRRDTLQQLYGSSWDEIRREMAYHPKRERQNAPPKVGKPGAAVLKARRERNKTAAKSRRRNRG